MSLRWDSVLTRALARELEEAWAGARLRALRLDGRTRDLVLLFRDRTALWRLHPDRGGLRVTGPLEPAPSDLRLRARLRGVRSPADERMLRFELVAERGRSGSFDLVVELIGNRWNAVVTEGPERVIRHVLVRREGDRPLLVGRPYVPPAPTSRVTDASVEAWRAALDPVPPAERPRALVRGFAWTSPLNAATILGAAAAVDDVAALDAAHARWARVAAGDEGEPVVIEGSGGPQPYPFPLIGVPTRRVPSLLAALERCADDEDARGEAPPSALALPPELLPALEEAVRHQERRVSRLRGELREVDDPAGLRAVADLILARHPTIPAGASHAVLADFEGGEVTVTLDPALAAHENADRYYDRARRAERAQRRLPGLIEKAESALARVERLRARAIAGEASAEEVRASLPERPGRSGPRTLEAALPYRSFRSSGGLEIRVGRGAAHNDELTFRHSAPGDVWLHARHTAGAHVVLRWTGPGAPPARDLEEAAVLAALHSKARTSGSVPVDWTLRKHVRKPRGARPGTVVPDRVTTLFVEPDEALLERLADGE